MSETMNKETHVDDPYVVSVRCSRFEERKKCAREYERAQVAKGAYEGQRAVHCKHHVLYCHVILNSVWVLERIAKVGDSERKGIIRKVNGKG
jgi:hypothetical protein